MTGTLREQIEKVVWHAMTSMAMSSLTLEQARAAPPSVKGNYDMLYLSNAVDAILTTQRSDPGDGVEAALRFMEAHHNVDACDSKAIDQPMSQCDDCNRAGRCAKRTADLLRLALAGRASAQTEGPAQDWLADAGSDVVAVDGPDAGSAGVHPRR